MKKLILAPLLLVLCCCSAEKKYESPSNDTMPKVQTATVLTPDLEKSFASICDTDTTIGILGDKWALQAYLPSPNGLLEKGKYAVEAVFTKGPELWKYIQPPAGPRLPSIPQNEEYAAYEIQNLVIEVHETTKAYAGPLIITISEFKVADADMRLPEKLSLPVRGPYP